MQLWTNTAVPAHLTDHFLWQQSENQVNAVYGSFMDTVWMSFLVHLQVLWSNGTVKSEIWSWNWFESQWCFDRLINGWYYQLVFGSVVQMFTESLNNKWKIPSLIPEGNTNPVRVASGVEICQFKHGAACCGGPSWIRVQLKVAAASIGMGMYALTENNAEYLGMNYTWPSLSLS